MTVPRPLLICVVGPTAIGKTALSIKIAQGFSAEIISADSRQFFKEMAIGTAVPSKLELTEVIHHFIQNKSILNDYSVGDFETEALNLLAQLFKKHPVVVMVGGSGLYVDAVVKGLDTFPKIDPKVRIQLVAEFELHGLTPLQQELEVVDPVYFNQVDINNHHRIIRALEIYRGSGQAFSSFLNKDKAHRAFDTLFVGLTAPREIIYERINHRVDLMIAAGLVEEARSLLPYRERNALQTVGYRELFSYFDGQFSLEEAISEIKKNTRRFAKRQGTWFRKNELIDWFNYDTPAKEIISTLKEKVSLENK